MYVSSSFTAFVQSSIASSSFLSYNIRHKWVNPMQRTNSTSWLQANERCEESGKISLFSVSLDRIFFPISPKHWAFVIWEKIQKLGQWHDRAMWCSCERNALKTKGLHDNNPNSVSKLIPGQEAKPKNILKKYFLEKALFVFRHKQVRHLLCGLQLIPLPRFWEQVGVSGEAASTLGHWGRKMPRGHRVGTGSTITWMAVWIVQD